MSYNTLPYLVLFLPLTLLIYQTVKQEKRKYILLFASWLYFWFFSRWLILYLIGTTAAVWIIGLLIGRWRNKTHMKHILALIGIGGVFGVLLYVKYTAFFAGILNKMIARLGGQTQIGIIKIAAPIGISFYTLEAAGYLLEVYWGRMSAETSFLRIALFLSFFPQTMEGPIALYKDTAAQLTAGKPVTQQGIFDGCCRILWGLFKKVVIADRLAVIVNELFNHFEIYSGVMIPVAAVSYTIQLYMEFSGVIDIVIGSGYMFGIKLPENFRQPFFSQSASEFWRRWHISLGTWLKTYLFYPVTNAGLTKRWNKYARKKYGKYISKVGTSFLALTPVWLFNGLWHGAKWNYIFYGIYYLTLLMLEVILDPLKRSFYRRFGMTGEEKGLVLFRVLRTWLIIFTGELFFRSDGVRQGMTMLKNMFIHFTWKPLWDGTLLNFGLDKADWCIIAAGVAVVFLSDLLAERNVNVQAWLEKRSFIIRWAAYYGLIFGVIIFGAYGPGYQAVDLIYAGF